MEEGNEVAAKEWLLEAEKLIETFRETRRLFLSTRVSNLLFVLSLPS
jgi:general transcription factor 3C polypeptide 3 (transcription factor C subunit 4)